MSVHLKGNVSRELASIPLGVSDVSVLPITNSMRPAGFVKVTYNVSLAVRFILDL